MDTIEASGTMLKDGEIKTVNMTYFKKDFLKFKDIDDNLANISDYDFILNFKQFIKDNNITLCEESENKIKKLLNEAKEEEN